MSFNQITFSEKKLSEKIFQKLNISFSNGHGFDLLFYKKDGVTHTLLEKKYLDNLLRYSFSNGGSYDPGMIQMFVPMLSMMFLPLTGTFNISKLKFDEIYAGMMKTNLAGKLSSNFVNPVEKMRGIQELQQLNENNENNEGSEKDNSQSFFGSFFNNIKDVWVGDEDDEDEYLDDFLVDNETNKNDKIDNKNDSVEEEKISKEKEIDEEEMMKNMFDSMLGKGLTDNDMIINKELIMFDFIIKINEGDDITKKIKDKNVEELYESGRLGMINQFEKNKPGGIKLVEFFGENNKNTRVVLSYETEDVNYEYNVSDIKNIQECLLKLESYINSDNETI